MNSEGRSGLSGGGGSGKGKSSDVAGDVLRIVCYAAGLSVLLPVHFAYKAAMAVLRVVGLGGIRSGGGGGGMGMGEEDEAFDFSPYLAPPGEKELDVVLFGATGFTGKLAARYLAEKYRGSDIRWALAGRRVKALEAIRDDLCRSDPSLASLPLLLADSGRLPSLGEMASRTRVVITTVGPFAKYGRLLVRACANCGTHYADITGETDFFRECVDRYDDDARRTGAKIVPHCGNDCIPWDMAVYEISKMMHAKGDALASVDCFDEYVSAPSGGTLATVALAMEVRERGGRYQSRLGYDPLLKTLAGGKSDRGFKVALQSGVGYNDKARAWCGQFFMAPVMANCVRRSNALLGYCQDGDTLRYYEGEVHPCMTAAVLDLLKSYCLGAMVITPPVASLCRALGVLPSPGEGPSEAFMNSGWLRVTAHGTGVRSSSCSCMVYFPSDPGYKETARMLVEAGLGLLDREGRLPRTAGGILTPAAALGDQMAERLVATGTVVART